MFVPAVAVTVSAVELPSGAVTLLAVIVVLVLFQYVSQENYLVPQ